MMKNVILVCALVGLATALRCYQGQQNASIPVQNSPIECLQNSMSCIKTYDMATNTVTRACQISNCTLNGQLTNAPVCTNTSSNTGSMYPSLTTYCCCYGDGCNSAPGRFLRENLLWVIGIPALAAAAKGFVF